MILTQGGSLLTTPMVANRMTTQLFERMTMAVAIFHTACSKLVTHIMMVVI